MNRTLSWEDCTDPDKPETPEDLHIKFWKLNNSELPAREITQAEHNLAWQKAWEYFQTLGLPTPNEHFRPGLKYVRDNQLLCSFTATTLGLPTIIVFGPPSDLKTIHRLNAA